MKKRVFRGYSLGYKSWVCGSLICKMNNVRYILYKKQRVKVDPSTVGELVHFDIDTKTRFWEGDYVELTLNELVVRGRIFYKNYMFGIAEKDGRFVGLHELFSAGYRMRLLGNIYQSNDYWKQPVQSVPWDVPEKGGMLRMKNWEGTDLVQVSSEELEVLAGVFGKEIKEVVVPWTFPTEEVQKHVVKRHFKVVDKKTGKSALFTHFLSR